MARAKINIYSYFSTVRLCDCLLRFAQSHLVELVAQCLWIVSRSIYSAVTPVGVVCGVDIQGV